MNSEPDEAHPVVLVKKDCDRHYGLEKGPCSKCAYYKKCKIAQKERASEQYGGRSWHDISQPTGD